MFYIFQHKLLVFFVFLIPILGWFFYLNISKKANLIVLLCAVFLFLPILFGYMYIIEESSILLIYTIVTFSLSYYGVFAKELSLV